MAPASIRACTGSVVIASFRSWQVVEADRRERRGARLRGQRLARTQIADEDRSAPVGEAEVVRAHHTQAEAYLGAYRVERRVERFLGDGEVGNPHRHNTALAPHEQDQR